MHDVVALREFKAARNGRNVLIVAAAVLLGIVAFQASALRNQKSVVVLVPSQFPDGTVAHGGEISPGYLEGLTRDAMYSLLNVSAETTTYARDNLGRIAAPHARVEILDLWDDIMEEVRRRKIATAFYPRALETSARGLTVIVDGELSTYLGTSLVSKEIKRYEVQFVRVNSSVRISMISELEIPS